MFFVIVSEDQQKRDELMESFKRAAEQAMEHARNWRKGKGNGGKPTAPKPKSGDEVKKKDLEDA